MDNSDRATRPGTTTASGTVSGRRTAVRRVASAVVGGAVALASAVVGGTVVLVGSVAGATTADASTDGDGFASGPGTVADSDATDAPSAPGAHDASGASGAPDTPGTLDVDVDATDAAPVSVDGSRVLSPFMAPSDGSRVSGTGVPGETVTVTFPDGETAHTIVEIDDTWTVPLPAVALVHGDVLEGRATNAAGTVSDPACTTVDRVAPEDPTVERSDGAEVVGGVDEPGEVVRVVDEHGEERPGAAIVGADGTFVVTPETPLTEGDSVFVVAIDPAGNESRPVRVVVDATEPDAASHGATEPGAASHDSPRTPLAVDRQAAGACVLCSRRRS